MHTSTQVKNPRTLWEGSGFMFVLQNGPDATRLFLPEPFVSKHWERKTKAIWIDPASLHSARDTRPWNVKSEKYQESWILHSLPCSPQRPYWFTEERSGRADSGQGWVGSMPTTSGAGLVMFSFSQYYLKTCKHCIWTLLLCCGAPQIMGKARERRMTLSSYFGTWCNRCIQRPQSSASNSICNNMKVISKELFMYLFFHKPQFLILDIVKDCFPPNIKHCLLSL